MRVRVYKEVIVEALVSITTEQIAEAIKETIEKEGERTQAVDLLTMCWQTIQGFTEQQVDMIGPANRPMVVSALRSLADRIEMAK